MPKEGAPVVPGAGAALRPKGSPFPNGEEAGTGVADACCPRTPNAPKPAQQATHLTCEEKLLWCRAVL